MKKLILSICTLTLVATSWAQTLDRSIRPKPGPAPEIKLGKSESFTLDNGLKVFVVENHKLPTVSCSIQLDITPELQGTMAGYEDMMSDLLTSGTKTRTNDQLNAEIDFLGANIGASDDGITGEGLKKHMDKIMELMSDIAMNSNIQQSELDKVKTRTLSGLEAAANDPDAMLSNVSSALNYGPNHPYGEVVTDETVTNITLDAVKKYYETYFRPNVAYMAIVGDVTIDEVKPLVEKYFGNWQKAEVPETKYNAAAAPSETRVGFAPRDAAVQSVINVTYPIDLKPGTSDVIKARVANSILGGGSDGRLFLNLREKHGWTYGSYASLVQDRLKGSFTAYAKARNVVTDSSVGEILAEMRKMNTGKVGKQELQNHIVNMSGAFAIGLENPSTIAQFAINVERYNMPKDYYKNYLKNLAAVTPEDVQTVSKKYINPAKAHILVVGDKETVAKTLTRFDAKKTITYYDNYGRIMKPAVVAAAPANMTGNDVLKKYIDAMGGESAIMRVKDIKTVSKGTVSAGGQTLELTITEIKKAPGKLRLTVEGMGMVLQKKVFDGQKGYEEQQGQRAEMEGDDLNDAREQADIYAELHPDQYKTVRTLKGKEQMNGVDVYSVGVVNAAGAKSTEYYEVSTGLLLKKVSSETAPDGSSVTSTAEFSNYKEVPGSNGYKVPYTVKQSSGPQSITANILTVEVNKSISDEEFK
jgi:zinc protease